MSFFIGLLLFVINFALGVYFFARAVLVPATLLVVEPTQLARRFLRRIQPDTEPQTHKRGASFDINVDARDLNRTLQSPSVLGVGALVMLVAFGLSGAWAYLMLSAAFAVSLLNLPKETLDERSFEQFARGLAAVSDFVLVAVLFFVTVFHLQADAFTLLSFMYLAREALLVAARRWLESDPDFEPYDAGTDTGKSNTRVMFGTSEASLAVTPTKSNGGLIPVQHDLSESAPPDDAPPENGREP